MRASDEARAADAKAALGRGEFTDALAAAEEILDPGLRGRMLADLHWRAGSPLAALEIASAALLEASNDLLLLGLAIDSGFAVGADAASRTRLERLRSIVGEDLGWRATLERYARFETEAQSGTAGADVVIVRARAALLLVAFGLIVAVWGLFRAAPTATA